MKIHGNSVASNFVNTSVLQKGARIGNGGAAATLSQSTLQLKAPNDVLKNFTNDLTRLKLTMQHSNDYETASKAVDDFMAMYDDYEQQGLFAGHEDEANLFKDSALHVTDEMNDKLLNEQVQHQLNELRAANDVGSFLGRALGLQEVSYSEESIARMTKLYEEKLKDGTLQSEAVDLLDFNQFQAFRESNKQMMETAQKEQDAYSLLIQKLASFKQSIIQ